MATVYVLVDPTNRKPFYVGSTDRDPSERKAEHRETVGDEAKTQYVRKLREQGLEPIFVKLLSVPRRAQHEAEFIVANLLARKYDLQQGVRPLNLKDALSKVLYWMDRQQTQDLKQGVIDQDLDLTQPWIYRRVKKVIAWCEQELSSEMPKQVHVDTLRTVFGQSQHNVSKYLRELLLVRHGGYRVGFTSYRYTVNAASLKALIALV